MKKHFIILSIGLLFYLSSFSQIDSLEIRLAGIITSTDTTTEAPFVHIINLRTGMGVISNTSGVFTTRMLKNDTIIFRCLGFSDFTFNLPDSISSTTYIISVDLSPTSYNLDVVDIYALNKVSQLRYDIKNFEYNDDVWKKDIYIPGVTKGRYVNSPMLKPNLLPKATGPASLIYNAFSKKAESLKKLMVLLAEDEIKEANKSKYNKLILQEFTGYSDAKLDSFYYYLNYSFSYIQQTSNYNIFCNIKSQMPTFEQKQQADSIATKQDTLK